MPNQHTKTPTRDHVVRIRMSTEEIETLDKAADKAKTTRSDLIRDRVFSGRLEATAKARGTLTAVDLAAIAKAVKGGAL